MFSSGESGQIEPNSQEVRAQCLALAKKNFDDKQTTLSNYGVTINEIAIILTSLVAPNAVKSVRTPWLQTFLNYYYQALEQFSTFKMMKAMQIP